MKKRSRRNLVPALILLAVGSYFLAQQLGMDIPFAGTILSWPSVLVIAGLFFLSQGYSQREDGQVFTGAATLGLGLYFHAVYTFDLWSIHWSHFTLIFGIAFLLKYRYSRRDGWIPGIILIGISLFSLFFQGSVRLIQETLGAASQFWPVILIGLGLYLLFLRKK
ncbi:LiaI-LiaF-like domain-containing protein [Alteribacter natronophilus]|uniref:LiaI-LiaF-like domain-containing protein n=1 Tax=Alteribacter natronophilus TaxID=2583810 RepID=UPI00110F3F94|nr:DUF5668 domain-containing protein [Alteribacter natronophilus]TMW71615.1 hypothetical protein FGB90_11315 [Alteribacter natronophilus]